VVVWAAALHCACSAASGGNAAGEFYVDGAGETLPMVCTRGAIIAQVCQPEAGIVLNDERKGVKQSHVGKYSLVIARVSTLSHYPNVEQKDTFWTATTFFCGDMQKSPVFGAGDHLYNNSIGQCTETRYICSAQITPSAYKFLDG